MVRIQYIINCTRIYLKKGLANRKTFGVAVLIAAFYSYHLSSLSALSAELGLKVSPWVFPHMFSPACLLLNGLFMTVLFSDLPCVDKQLQFILIRTDRLIWGLGQIGYTVVVALLYTIYSFFISVIVLIPNVQITSDWGNVLKTLSINKGIAEQYSITIDFKVSEIILQRFNAVDGTLIALGFFLMTTIFAGFLILCLNKTVRRGSGIVFSGLLSCLCFFGYYGGQFVFGSWISYISPYLWATNYYLNWGFPGVTFPSPIYALLVSSCGSILMCLVFLYFTCRQDIMEE